MNMHIRKRTLQTVDDLQSAMEHHPRVEVIRFCDEAYLGFLLPIDGSRWGAYDNLGRYICSMDLFPKHDTSGKQIGGYSKQDLAWKAFSKKAHVYSELDLLLRPPTHFTPVQTKRISKRKDYWYRYNISEVPEDVLEDPEKLLNYMHRKDTDGLVKRRNK